ncbi:SRPBCC family protein [Caulobacter sp. KR2-114]|uniref:SRPBCC family protein n=1 Tax=Caulobacter sp. KR2-114 TaxID=3400912 RepID=UPI003BFA9C8E
MQPVRTEVTVHAKARPETVYAVAKDSSLYPVWSRIGAFEHVRDGEGERYGVGSVRIFRTWPLTLVEEVVELIPGRRVSYIVHSGLPFRDYRADIDITPAADGGSEIRWSNRFWPTFPGGAALMGAFMRSVFRQMTPQLAAEAERLERQGMSAAA